MVSHQKINVAPGYQVPFAEKVKKEAGIAVRAVGMIADPQQAEDIIASGKADMVALARGLLDNPRWVWHAAERFGVKLDYPPQYARSHSSLWPGAAIARPASVVPAKPRIYILSPPHDRRRRRQVLPPLRSQSRHSIT